MSEEQKSLDQFEKNPSEQTSDKRDTSLGRLPVEWVVRSLGEDFAIEYGNEKPEKELQTDGFPVYGANGIIGYGNEYLFDESVVAVTCRGATCGNVHLTQPQSWVTNNSLVLTGGEKINKRYLLDSLRYHSVERAISGSAQPQITATMLSKMDYCAPSLPEQRKIATVLHNVDQAIQKTEEITVQFERVHQGLLRNLIPGGIGHDEYDDIRVLGRTVSIPATWEVTTVSEACREIIDYRGKNPEFSNDGIPHLRNINISRGEITLEELKYVSKDTYEEWMTRGIPQEGDTLLSTEAPMGNTAILPELKFSLSQRLIVLRSGEQFDNSFFAHLMGSPFVQKEYEARATGSTVKGISNYNLQDITVPVPPIEEQKQIAEHVDNSLEAIKKNEQYRNRLTRLKQGLMQDLLSGKVRTTDTNIEVPDEIAQHG